jgi:hypothetical protein
MENNFGPTPLRITPIISGSDQIRKAYTKLRALSANTSVYAAGRPRTVIQLTLKMEGEGERFSVLGELQLRRSTRTVQC